ncbi:MAG: DNA-directed RNA polymerase [archaeon]
MFYITTVKDHIRVPPRMFSDNLEESIIKQIKAKYEGYISKDRGIVIDVSKIRDIKDGIIIPEDGASYYETTFDLITFNADLHEVFIGKIKDIADFGAFISLGPIEGMIHVSQTMDDFVSFSKDKVLLGKETKRSLKVNDICRARMIATSYKDVANPKFGLTMRQPGFGKLEWFREEKK